MVSSSSFNVNISLPSLRIDAFSLDIMQKVQDIKKSSLTFAPEAGSQRLRNVINKGLTVDNIMNGKIEENQFTDADITIRELNTVSAEIKTYLMQMYHSRVAYPKRNRKAGR